MKFRISLRARIALLVVVAIVPLFGMSIFKALHNADAAVEQAEDDLRFAASLAAASQQRIADSARQVLSVIASLPGMQDGGANFDCDRYFSGLTRQLPEYANLGAVNLDGQTRCHALGSAKKAFLGDRAYFRDAIALRRFVVGLYAVGRLADKPVLTFAQPLVGSDGKVTGVVYASFDLARLGESLAGITLPAGAAVGIQDREGTLLAGKPVLPIKVGEKVRSPVLIEALKTMATGVGQGADGAGRERLWAYTVSSPHPESAVFVSVSMDRGLVVGPSQRQLWIELTALALVALLGGWVAWMIAGRAIVAPARQLLHATWRLEKGHLDARIPVDPNDIQSEFSGIAAGFNLMADSLEHRERVLQNELTRNRQAYATLELTINSMQEGLMAVDAAGRLLLINETAAQLFAIDDMSLVLAPQWPQQQGLFVPGTQTLYAFNELPLYKALRGESGGPLPVLLRNEREPAGRLINCTYRPMEEAGEIVGALMVFSDVTEMERLQLEQTRGYEELREAQRKLLNAQRLGRIGNWERNLKTGQGWWSDEVYELYGLAKEDFDPNGDNVVGMIHPDDRSEYLRLREEATREGKPLDTEYRVTLPDGKLRWIHQHGETQTDSSGAAILRAGVVQDITARKLAEQAAARTTELLRRTGEMAKIGGWEVILADMRVVWSEQVYRIHEMDPGVPVSVEATLMCYAPEAQAVIGAAARAAAEHGIPWDLELPLVTAKNRRIWVKTQGRALWEDGKITRVVGALQDISEKHASEEQLRLLETAISRLNDIVLITGAEIDASGPRIVFVNDAFERRTGYSRDEVLGRSPRLLQGPNTQRAELERIGAALRSWQPARGELINYTKAGREFWIELDIVPIADGKGQFTHWVSVERDITHRKLAEQALVNSERRYAVLFKAAPVPMWIVDSQSQMFVAVNEACTRRYGYTHDEFMGMNIYGIRSEEEGRRLKAEIGKGVRQDVNRRLHRSKDGTEFHVETISRTIQYEGQDARFVVALDITAQIKAEKDVQDYLFTLERAADATQAITRHRTVEATMQETVDQARAVVSVHLAVVSLTVAGAEQSRTINAVSHSDKYANCRDFVRFSHGCGLYGEVVASNHPMRLTQPELEAHPRWTGFGNDAGTDPPMRGWLAVPLTGRNGENIGLLQLSDKYEGDFTLQDQYVTVELAQLASIAIENARLFEQVQQLNQGLEEKVAERTAALARQEALFRALAEQAPQVVWNADAEGHMTYVNRKWYELMGGTPEDWMGTKWMTAIHPDDLPALSASWESSRQSLQPYEGMRRVLAMDGTYHTMAYRGSPVLDEKSGEVLFWVGIDADVTEIKAIESALRLSNQELEAFSYSVSHDLRSPLNTIDGFSRLLAKQLDAAQPNEKVQHYLARIQAGVAQMGRLIEDLLSLAQVTRMQLRHETVDLSAIAHEIADECRGRNPERVASIQIEEGLQVQGDGRLVRVVMENLLGNAWKFSSRQAHADIRVGRTTDAAGLPVLFVQDNGAGFDMAYADKLFNTFQRLHAVTEFPGTGIGLATVSRVISRHGGQVWAQAEPGKGATFFFTLPGVATVA